MGVKVAKGARPIRGDRSFLDRLRRECGYPMHFIPGDRTFSIRFLVVYGDGSI